MMKKIIAFSMLGAALFMSCKPKEKSKTSEAEVIEIENEIKNIEDSTQDIEASTQELDALLKELEN